MAILSVFFSIFDHSVRLNLTGKLSSVGDAGNGITVDGFMSPSFSFSSVSKCFLGVSIRRC